MGKRLNISQPAVIQTELRPLSESFWIDANGQLEQWYYQNTGVFAPDRLIVPLCLTPMLSLLDLDTNTSYSTTANPATVTFQGVEWKVKEWNGSAWVETTITSVSSGDNYYLRGNNLYVRKNNYDAAHAINIICRANYQDPRDIGTTCWLETTLMLSTNMDATQVYPTIDIKSPAARMFNPLKDDPIFEFEGACDWSALEGQGGVNITEYKADALGTEEIIQNNEEQIINAAPLMDIKYGDRYIVDGQGNHIPQQFMDRQTSGGTVSDINDGVAKISNIKGDTVKFNQKVTNGNFEGTSGWVGVQSNLSASDNELTVTVGDAPFTFVGARNNYTNEIRGENHKLYVSANIKTNNNSSGQLFVVLGDVATDKNRFMVQVAGVNNQYVSIKSIATNPQNNANYFYVGQLSARSGVVLKVKNVIMIDLTEIFGSGNEPATTAEVEAWLAAHIGNLDYIPYTTGKLVNCGGYSVKWNQLADATTTSVSTTSGHKYYTKVGNTRSIVASSGSAISVTGGSDFVIDLTLMFGDGNEPDLAWCNKYLSRDYYDYCESVDKNIMGVMETKSVVGGVSQYKTLPMGIKTTFNMFGDKKNAIPVEYIENLKGAVFETDLIPNGDDYTFETKMYLAGYYTNDAWLAWFGTYTAEEANAYRFIRYNNFDDRVYVNNHQKAAAGKVVNILGADNMYTIRLTSSQVVVNDVVTELTGTTGTDNTGKLRIMQANTHLRLYYFKVYKSDVLIMDLIPVRIGNVGYLYDKVSGKMYGNRGTGGFLFGNDLPHWESFSDMSWITKIGIENFNIWDEEWEAGTWNADGQKATGTAIRATKVIPVNPSTEYFISCGSEFSKGIIMRFVDSDNSVISSSVYKNKTFTTPSGCVGLLMCSFLEDGVNTYNHDICINKSASAYNGKYLPHGQTMPYFPQGLCNVGNVYDEVKVENGKIKGVVRMGYINLGDLTWGINYAQASAYCFVSDEISNLLNNDDSTVAATNLVCSKYESKDFDGTVRNNYDKAIATRADNKKLVVNDRAYTDAAIFKAALNGVYLIYELTTPYEFEIDYPTKGQFEWYGVDGSGNEVPIDTLPVYSQAEQPSGYGQHSSRIRINALYGENIPVILRVKRYPWSTGVLPPKIIKSVAWKLPPLEVIVTSNKGSAVRSEHLQTATNFTFSAIVNQQGEVISDEVKQANLVFKWYYVKYGVDGQAAEPVLAGTGLTVDISTNILKNATPEQEGAVMASTNVYCEVFLLGAYHIVDGTYVRTID